ncbi:hypothetical protein FSPOR_2812 [Fusarium sporotrichioides]|uniref:Uncharacterized protein n=1 Tax=Fusarium sporotrichioides TaxID=5514 RepID=A0A395SJE2_FUSSP|nr:hypothetical protein FSPOR_2812 [Fusarium sporotrichioides]
MEDYKAKREARLEHDQEWWGESHVEPDEGDPDRQHIYAHNPPISDQEFRETAQAFKESIKIPEKKKYDSQAVHLRSTTPPMERAKRALQGLKEQGVQVTPELVKEVTSHYTTNSGIVAALTEWCAGDQHVPVEHANEMQKRSDRLKLEMATQQRDLQDELYQTKKSLKESIKEANDSQQQIETLKADLENAQKQNEVAKICIEGSEKEYESAKKDVQNFTAFHDKAFRTVKKHSATWIATKKAYDELSQDDEKAVPAIRTLIDEITEHWKELDHMYDIEWPPMAKDLEQGEADGMGLLSLLEQRRKELKDKENEIERLNKELEEKDQVVEKLKLKIDETSSLSSSEVSGKDTPEHRRVSPITSTTPSSNSSQVEEEIKRLRRENSDLQQKLAGNGGDKSNASSSTDTSLQDGNELQEALGEIRNLKAQVQMQTGNINQINNISREKDREFKKLRQEGNLHRHRLKRFEGVHFKTTSSLVEAIGKYDTASYIEQTLGLRDRINYLNLACFFRTRSYILMAIRVGSNRMANILLKDIKGWAEFCRQDFETMDPSVNIQIETSIRILYAMRGVLTTETEKGVKEAQESIRTGLDVLKQYPDDLASSQLVRIANTILKRTEDGQGTGMYKGWLRIADRKFHVEKILKTSSKSKIRDTSDMTTDKFALPAFHNPDSPSKQTE